MPRNKPAKRPGRGRDNQSVSKLDLIIINDDGVYHLGKDQWMTAANRLDPDFAGDAGVLVKRGAVVADVPISDIPVGFYCFLVNFGQLRDSEAAPDQTPEAQTGTPLGDDGLIIHMRPNAYFIVRKDDWQKTKAENPPYDMGDPVICAETENGFVINLPRIRTPAPKTAKARGRQK